VLLRRRLCGGVAEGCENGEDGSRRWWCVVRRSFRDLWWREEEDGGARFVVAALLQSRWRRDDGGAAAEMTARRLCARRDAGVGAVEMAMVVACRCRIVVAGNGGGCRGG